MSQSEERQSLEQPLAGLRVLVTRPRLQARDLGLKLEEAGAAVRYHPTIAITRPSSWDQLDRAVRLIQSGEYAWVAFTSVNAVSYLWDRLEAANLDPSEFEGVRVAAVGKVTAARLLKHGVRPNLIPKEYTGEGLADALGRGLGRILLPRSESAPDDLIKLLRANGWTPEHVDAYRTIPVPVEGDDAKAIRAGDFDVVSITSGSTASGYHHVGGPPDKVFAAIGPKAAAVARDHGYQVTVEAKEQTAEGLVRALIDARAEGKL